MKMAPKKIENWKDFEEMIDGAETEYQNFKENSKGLVSHPLYRGQSNSAWGLETTLERFLGKNISVEKYYRLIHRIQPIVESCTSNCWQLPEIEEELKELYEKFGMSTPLYEFMAHLRHHQFPSPFLDWTRSPYIAAFFAFNEDRKTDSAIYVYFSDIGEGKSFISDIPYICNKGGKYVKTHKRHMLQQSEYTYCVVGGRSTHNKVFYKYASHEEVFSPQKERSNAEKCWIKSDQQDIRVKYTLPYSQRKNFLDKLNQMNINAYSLFANEEGLMHKIAIEELLLKDLWTSHRENAPQNLNCDSVSL